MFVRLPARHACSSPSAFAFPSLSHLIPSSPSFSPLPAHPADGRLALSFVNLDAEVKFGVSLHLPASYPVGPVKAEARIWFDGEREPGHWHWLGASGLPACCLHCRLALLPLCPCFLLRTTRRRGPDQRAAHRCCGGGGARGARPPARHLPAAEPAGAGGAAAAGRGGARRCHLPCRVDQPAVWRSARCVSAVVSQQLRSALGPHWANAGWVPTRVWGWRCAKRGPWVATSLFFPPSAADRLCTIPLTPSCVTFAPPRGSLQFGSARVAVAALLSPLVALLPAVRSLLPLADAPGRPQQAQEGGALGLLAPRDLAIDGLRCRTSSRQMLWEELMQGTQPQRGVQHRAVSAGAGSPQPLTR